MTEKESGKVLPEMGGGTFLNWTVARPKVGGGRPMRALLCQLSSAIGQLSFLDA